MTDWWLKEQISISSAPGGWAIQNKELANSVLGEDILAGLQMAPSSAPVLTEQTEAFSSLFL